MKLKKLELIILVVEQQIVKEVVQAPKKGIQSKKMEEPKQKPKIGRPKGTKNKNTPKNSKKTTKKTPRKSTKRPRESFNSDLTTTTIYPLQRTKFRRIEMEALAGENNKMVLQIHFIDQESDYFLSLEEFKKLKSDIGNMIEKWNYNIK